MSELIWAIAVNVVLPPVGMWALVTFYPKARGKA